MLLTFKAFTEEYTYKDNILTLLLLSGSNLLFISLSIFLGTFVDLLNLKNGMQIPIYFFLCWIIYYFTNYCNSKIAQYCFRKVNLK